MSLPAQAHATQTVVNSVAAVTIVAASGDGLVYRDLVGLIVTTALATAGTLTLSDGTKTVAVLNFPDAALAPQHPLVIPMGDMPLPQSVANAVWQITASQTGVYNVTAIWVERQ